MDNEENDSLCERILRDLDNIFKKDSYILEFDIINVVESTCNKSPVIYEFHNIALEKWCVPHLYEYAYKKILNFKKQNNNRSEYSLVHQWTRIILLLNPDFTTAWNLRRNLLVQKINTHQDELKFTELVLTRKPKCASVFSYREWILNNHFSITKILNENLILDELRITLKAADRYPRNYYAWSHRTWIITVYIKNSSINYILNKIINELTETEKWLEQNISDYSCFQHRQCLLNLYYNVINDTNYSEMKNGYPTSSSSTSILNDWEKIFFHEFEILDNLWKLYTEQESLFLHRRFLLHSAVKYWCFPINSLKEKENQFYKNTIRKLLEESSSISSTATEKSLHLWRKELIKRYLFYLQRNLNWKFENTIAS